MPVEDTDKTAGGSGLQNVAFAFDIDGVLLRGKEPLPGASETLSFLQKHRIPFIFLTNGGGLTETDHVARLGLRLNLSLDDSQFVQSHTPFRDLVGDYGNEVVLAIGGHGHNIRNLARAYGFSKAVTASDVMAWTKHIHPFPEMTETHHDEHGQKENMASSDGSPFPVKAILIFSSPRDWCLDMQIVVDLLLSTGGDIRTRSASNRNAKLPNHGYQQDRQPPLFFCNPDLQWATQHDHPRLAQGAFLAALKGIWAEITHGTASLNYTVYGKPTRVTYEYGERVLMLYHAKTESTNGTETEEKRRIDTVYMIGDNPASDIQGANAYQSVHGASWKSILVETGVYEAGSVPEFLPTFYAKNVKDAVLTALGHEGIALEDV